MTTLNCPDCKQALELRTFGEVMVDICSSCNGIWLDVGEFNELVAARFPGVPLEEAFEIAAISLTPRQCPHGHGEMRLIDVGGAEIDICQVCRGLWLEAEDRDAIKAYEPPAQSEEAPPRPEVELPPAPMPDDSPVPCASCGEETSPLRALYRQDAYWCEACVVEGDYPGGLGPPTARRIHEMALSQAKYQSNRQAAKDARDMREANKDRVEFHHGRFVRGSWSFEEYELAVLRFKSWLSETRDRFQGKG